jgi:hypothetical protein
MKTLLEEILDLSFSILRYPFFCKYFVVKPPPRPYTEILFVYLFWLEVKQSSKITPYVISIFILFVYRCTTYVRSPYSILHF